MKSFARHCNFFGHSYLFYGVKKNTTALYLVPMWQLSVNYHADSVRLKQTDVEARHQLPFPLLGKIKALKFNECIAFTCCYIIYALLTHPSPLSAYN